MSRWKTSENHVWTGTGTGDWDSDSDSDSGSVALSLILILILILSLTQIIPAQLSSSSLCLPRIAGARSGDGTVVYAVKRECERTGKKIGEALQKRMGDGSEKLPPPVALSEG